MNILMIPPHDIYSTAEPWTVRVTYLADEFTRAGHHVRVVYHPLDRSTPLEVQAGQQRFAFPTYPFRRENRFLWENTRRLAPHARWADVIHFQKCFSYVSLPALALGAFRNSPVHYDWDDWEYEIYNFAPLNRTVGYSIDAFERALPRLVDTLSCASEALKDLAERRGFPRHRIFDAPVGADTRRFHPGVSGARMRRKHDLDRKVVLYLGQLHGAQYAELFVHAAKMVLDRRDDALFLVVGTGDRFGLLHYLAEQLHISHKLVFTGGVDHRLIPEYIAAADVAVACFEDTPQTRCKSPLKIVEYLAMGKAIVASEMGEVSRMIGDAGVLVPPADAAALAIGIEQLLDDEGLRRELGRRARLRAEETYNWTNTAANLLEAYEVGVAETKGRYRPRLLSTALELRPAKVRDFLQRNRDLMGVLDGTEAFVGPNLLQIDPTFTCNADCIGCWCRSPLLHDKMMPLEEQRIALPWNIMERLIQDAAALGTKEIYLAGGGEPFMYPHIMPLLRLIKRQGLVCYLNTNFLLADQRKLDEIIELGIDHITLSVWAGTPEVYSLTHPNKTAESFEQIRRMLTYLNEHKRNRKPLIKIYNVISNLNYHDLHNMLAFAVGTGSESIEFTVTDVIPGRTDFLLLNAEQQRCCHELALEIRAKAHTLPRDFTLFRFDQFLRRLAANEALTGDYDAPIIHELPCTIGWTFGRVNSDGDVNACLKSHKKPIGNLHQQRFREIWSGHNEKMAQWRRHTRVFEKKGPFFKDIGNDPTVEVGCVKSCDDLGRNTFTYDRLLELGPLRRRALALAAKVEKLRGTAL